ncbi:precorrin-3B C(17)-methyltransferase [Actinomadura sp. NBRC 104425]|uniref:precorrin-3B C(17)-methyltransferase n=1 Tax=Actinomadura sp. NBRC 104425 TaxID=3032204 RepID=UPI0024A526E8|nr:precorrin-3B C(17)-methyltransferase [Actinomadura sp. NBRC 104425]GLZ13561.1 precorrin-3B C(17)-methyltransferase [Actinomadura sp. NBRC 104425]
MTIGIVAATAGGRTAADALAAAWPGQVRLFTDVKAADGLREAWRTCDAIVSFLAVGATVRVLAPLLERKATDPAVVCVDEGMQFAVALLGGHHGANELTHRLAGVLGCTPVVTTASDQANVTPLDSYGADLGFTVHNPDMLPYVGAAVLSGEPVLLEGADDWPLPPLPPNVRPWFDDAGPSVGILVTDGAEIECVCHEDWFGNRLVYRPPSLVVGVGSARGVAADEIDELIGLALDIPGLAAESVRCLATVDRKADEEGILEAARRRGWQVVAYPAEVLARVEVPNPSPVVAAEVGTPSVAEAAALHAARTFGRAAELVTEKTKSANATAAVARLRPRGRLSIVGLGPGARDLLTPRAAETLRRSSVVVGLDQYLDQVRDLLRPGTRVLGSGLGREEERARTAVREAAAGRAVALIGSGDAGVYAMASPALEMLAAEGAAHAVDVDGVPGITAAAAASALLGAPLGHDHAYVSLSDLHTPWEVIERRVHAAAEGDFTVCFYNPRSRARDWQLAEALRILAGHRPPHTPVGLVRNATRPDESVTLTTLADVDPAQADMYTVVLVGSSRSRAMAGRFVTPRGYRWA